MWVVLGAFSDLIGIYLIAAAGISAVWWTARGLDIGQLGGGGGRSCRSPSGLTFFCYSELKFFFSFHDIRCQFLRICGSEGIS